jgi:hypothetical protein
MGGLLVISLLASAYALAAFYPDWREQADSGTSTAYQQREDRFEGVKRELAAGYDIELLSAVADYREQRQGLGERAEIRFAIPADSSLGSVTVRELHTRYHYWLDRVEPRSGWQSGRENTFAWRTRDVLQQLIGLTSIYDLGVVVRLNDAQPRPVERVSPAILSYGGRPSAVGRFAFAVRTNGPAALKAFAVNTGGRSLIQEFASVPPAEAVWIAWPRTTDSTGWKTLHIEGDFLDSNDQIRKTIHFFDWP